MKADGLHAGEKHTDIGSTRASHMGSFELQLCDIQGRLFELAQKTGVDCPWFVHVFMTGDCATALDQPFDRLQWAGEEYILEELEDEHGPFPAAGDDPAKSYSLDSMFWMGYLYRYWHFYKHESSTHIYALADADRLHTVYPAYHTLDPAAAIDRLIESL